MQTCYCSTPATHTNTNRLLRWCFTLQADADLHKPAIRSFLLKHMFTKKETTTWWDEHKLHSCICILSTLLFETEPDLICDILLDQYLWWHCRDISINQSDWRDGFTVYAKLRLKIWIRYFYIIQFTFTWKTILRYYLN